MPDRIKTSAQIGEMLARKRRVFLGLAKRYTLPGVDPEDCVQDAALLALRDAGGFQGRAALSTWFGTIVRNCALMRGRRVRFADVSVEVEDLLSYLPDPRPSAEATHIASMEQQRLRAAIMRLSPVLRETLLHRIGGLSLQEIAGLLNIPTGTVKARLSRAKDKIRQRMGASA